MTTYDTYVFSYAHKVYQAEVIHGKCEALYT